LGVNLADSNVMSSLTMVFTVQGGIFFFLISRLQREYHKEKGFNAPTQLKVFWKWSSKPIT